MWDHIPPKSLFDILPGQTIKGDLITVGAHKSCNKAHQHDDEYLVFAAVIGAVEKNAMAQRVFENMYRGFQRPQASRFLNSLVSKMDLIEVHTEAGIYLGKRPIFEYDPVRIRRIIFRMCRGLHFRETGKILSDAHPCRVVNAEQFFKLREVTANKNEFKNVCDGVFRYAWVTEETNRLNGYLWLTFYDTLDLVAAIGNRAKSLAEKMAEA
jgi:hypothetical protein